MKRYIENKRNITKVVCASIFLAGFSPNLSFAAPTITSVNGSLSHGQALVISGSGFGTKTVALPLVWDNCSGTKITDKWSGGWPDSGTSTYKLQYQSPIRGVNLPHSNISKYMTGAHGDSSGYNSGYNVMAYKTLTGVTYPKYVYLSAYVRLDPSWSFGGDNNLKVFDFSNGSNPYTMNTSSDSNWYIEYNGRFSSSNGTGEWHLNDDGGSLMNPDANGTSWWWSSAKNPFSNWIKQEYEISITNQNNGYIRVYEDGVLKVNYSGPTDKYTGSTKSIALGGYSRMYGSPNNYRYFADIYMDASPSRIILGNASTYTACTIRELQLPSSWTASSINMTVNLGKFNSGSTAYIYVMDSTGVVNSSGYAVTIGGSGSATPPAPSLNLIKIQ